MRGGAIRRRLGRSCRDERGVVLVFVGILMVVLLGFTGLAIDVGTWYGTQRQAQAAADSAALAGAQDLPGSQSTASTNASLYAQKDFPGVTVATPTFPQADEIKVTVTVTAPVFFAKIFGISAPTVTATATAQKTASSTLCATPGTTCYAIFAKDSTCTSGHYGINFSGGGNTINGGILSNGNVNSGGGGSNFNGPDGYGPTAPGCTWNNSGGGNTFGSGPTPQTTITTTWPIDYTTDFPSCTGAGCTGPGGTPSFCTQSTTVTPVTLSPVSGNIYCAVGSGTAGTPSTWNGAITINAGGLTAVASYVGGTVALSGGGDTLTACGYASAGYNAATCNASVPTPPTGNYPLVYATSTSATAINGGGGGSFVNGDLFAPNGTITFNGGGDTTSFLEALDVVYSGGGLTGDGPSDSGTGTSTTGQASLLQ